MPEEAIMVVAFYLLSEGHTEAGLTMLLSFDNYWREQDWSNLQRADLFQLMVYVE